MGGEERKGKREGENPGKEEGPALQAQARGALMLQRPPQPHILTPRCCPSRDMGRDPPAVSHRGTWGCHECRSPPVPPPRLPGQLSQGHRDKAQTLWRKASGVLRAWRGGRPHGVGAIPQPAGFRGAAPGRGGCSVSSPGLWGQNEGCGAKMRAMGPAGGGWVALATASSWYGTLLPLNLGDAPGGAPLPLVPPTPSCSRLILRQRKPGQAGSAPLGMWGAGAGMGAPRARKPSQLTAHPAGPFQPSRIFFSSRQTRGEAG